MKVILDIIEKNEIEKNGPEFLEAENNIKRARPASPDNNNKSNKNNASNDMDDDDYDNTMDLKKKE